MAAEFNRISDTLATAGTEKRMKEFVLAFQVAALWAQLVLTFMVAPISKSFRFSIELILTLLRGCYALVKTFREKHFIRGWNFYGKSIFQRGFE